MGIVGDKQIAYYYGWGGVLAVEEYNILMIHPTNNSDIDVGLPCNILLRDVFCQLIDAGFLSTGQYYNCVLVPNDNRKERIALDNDKTISENGIENNDVIQILTATQAGGGGDVACYCIESIYMLWNSFYPYLDQINTILGITVPMLGFGMWVNKKFSKKYTPKQFTEKITDKELWNYHELALKLDISDDEAKKLLKGFGYKWNRNFSLYCKTDKTVDIIKKVKHDIM